MIIYCQYFGHLHNDDFKKKFINFTGKKSQITIKHKKNKIFVYLRKKMKIFPLIKILQSKYEIYSNNSSKRYNIKYHDLNTGLHQFSFLLARPGLGTISDAIRFKVPILSYVEKSDTREMFVNNELINKYKIGILLNKNKKSINEVLDIHKNKKKYKKYLNNLTKFKFNGENDIVNYVKKI